MGAAAPQPLRYSTVLLTAVRLCALLWWRRFLVWCCCVWSLFPCAGSREEGTLLCEDRENGFSDDARTKGLIRVSLQ